MAWQEAWQEVPQATHTGMAEAEGYDRPGDFCCCGKTPVAECGPREGQLRNMDRFALRDERGPPPWRFCFTLLFVCLKKGLTVK